MPFWEMGDTEENIIEMRKQNVDNDGLLDDDYLEEIVVTEDGRAPKKIEKKNLFQEIKAKKDTSVVRTGQFRQVSLAKYSGMYWAGVWRPSFQLFHSAWTEKEAAGRK